MLSFAVFPLFKGPLQHALNTANELGYAARNMGANAAGNSQIAMKDAWELNWACFEFVALFRAGAYWLLLGDIRVSKEILQPWLK